MTYSYKRIYTFFLLSIILSYETPACYASNLADCLDAIEDLNSRNLRENIGGIKKKDLPKLFEEYKDIKKRISRTVIRENQVWASDQLRRIANILWTSKWE